MNLLDFLQRLLGRQSPSADTARERLQLVLAHDRSDLNPDLLEQMRREILEVVQRYVEIDLEGGDVNLSTENQITALVANLPIKRALPQPLPQDAGNSQDAGNPAAADADADASDAGPGQEADPEAPPTAAAGGAPPGSSITDTPPVVDPESSPRVAPVPAWVSPENP